MSVSAASPPSGVRSVALWAGRAIPNCVAASQLPRVAWSRSPSACRVQAAASPAPESSAPRTHRPSHASQAACRTARAGAGCPAPRGASLGTGMLRRARARKASRRQAPSSPATALRLHVHLVAYERFAGLSEIVVVSSVPGGIIRQTLPRRS